MFQSTSRSNSSEYNSKKEKVNKNRISIADGNRLPPAPTSNTPTQLFVDEEENKEPVQKKDNSSGAATNQSSNKKGGIKPIWESDFYSKQHYNQFIDNYDDLKDNNDMFSMIINQLQESPEYFEFEEKDFYETREAIFSGFDPGSRGSFSKRDGGYFSEHKIYLNNYSSFGNGDNSYLNGVRHKATIFEEAFHAGQYLHYGNGNNEKTHIQKEVEAKVAKAYTGTFSEDYIKKFAENPLVKEYFKALEDKKEIPNHIKWGYEVALLELADIVFGIYEKTWAKKGDKFLDMNKPENNEFNNEYLSSLIKKK